MLSFIPNITYDSAFIYFWLYYEIPSIEICCSDNEYNEALAAAPTLGDNAHCSLYRECTLNQHYNTTSGKPIDLIKLVHILVIPKAYNARNTYVEGAYCTL